jgi:hypothetical protein
MWQIWRNIPSVVKIVVALILAAVAIQLFVTAGSTPHRAPAYVIHHSKQAPGLNSRAWLPDGASQELIRYDGYHWHLAAAQLCRVQRWHRGLLLSSLYNIEDGVPCGSAGHLRLEAAFDPTNPSCGWAGWYDPRVGVGIRLVGAYDGAACVIVQVNLPQVCGRVWSQIGPGACDVGNRQAAIERSVREFKNYWASLLDPVVTPLCRNLYNNCPLSASDVAPAASEATRESL